MRVQAERRSILKIKCAWCGKAMGEKDGQGVEGTSHSICPHCLSSVLTQCEAEGILNPN